jgi:hypothetical protein
MIAGDPRAKITTNFQKYPKIPLTGGLEFSIFKLYGKCLAKKFRRWDFKFLVRI